MGPNFFIIGAPKCGTTSIAELLGQHEDVYFCPKKEPRFFSHESLYNRGVEYYEGLFEGVEGQKRVGEGSTTYSEAWVNRDKKSAERIHEYCPSARIIYCVRHPLRRIESHYLDIIWALNNDLIPEPEIERRSLSVTGNFGEDITKNRGVIETSNYWKRLEPYKKNFSDEQIYVVFLEDLRATPSQVLRSCCDFLEIDPTYSFEDPDEARNESTSKGLATGFGRLIRALPGYQTIAGGVPLFLKRLVRPLIRDPFTEKPDWSPKLRDTVVSEIEEDVKSFLEYAGKPRDYWTLE